ncbi:MAG: BPSL0067 family protein [Planctomycetales bacterium]|nr:BPSL0067 family protein [Planctomycetales bacterium]
MRHEVLQKSCGVVKRRRSAVVASGVGRCITASGFGRCAFNCLAIATLMIAFGLVGPGQAAEAAQRWVTSQKVLSVLQNPGNYAEFKKGEESYLVWSTGGTALRGVLPRGSTAIELNVGKKSSGTQVPDGARNECVGFVRGVSGAPGSHLWQRGQKVFWVGQTVKVSPGTLIATFQKNSKGGYDYSGHCAIFLGYLSNDRGIAVVDQNWGFKCVKWHSLKGMQTNALNDANAYYVVLTP